MTVSVTAATACYDGTDVFPVASAPVQTRLQRTVQLTVTALIVAGPFAGLAAAVWLLWGHGVGFFDVGLGLFFYLVTGFGATVGFHRCLRRSSGTRPTCLPTRPCAPSRAPFPRCAPPPWPFLALPGG